MAENVVDVVGTSVGASNFYCMLYAPPTFFSMFVCVGILSGEGKKLCCV